MFTVCWRLCMEVSQSDLFNLPVAPTGVIALLSIVRKYLYQMV